MRYCQGFLLQPTAGSVATALQRFRANSIYDPDQSGTGHQPLGHDQWAAFYDHYVVLGSKIKCTFNYGEAVNAAPLIAAISLEDTTNITPATVASSITEQGKAPFKFLGMTQGKQGPVTVYNTYSCKKFNNVKDVKDNIDTLGGLFAGDPPESTYFTVSVSQYADTVASTSDIVTCYAEIDYIVLCSEPKFLPQS